MIDSQRLRHHLGYYNTQLLDRKQVDQSRSVGRRLTVKKQLRSVGVVSYGAYLPVRAVDGATINAGVLSSPVKQKTFASIDEDTITIAVEAVSQTLSRAEYVTSWNRQLVNGLFIGSESHPYAVKPSGTVVAKALGLSENLSVADLQFACKAGTQAMQIAYQYALGSGQVVLAVGADTAQSRPQDALEYTAASGGACFLIAPEIHDLPILAEIMGSCSVATDTPDFWRRPTQSYPEHAGRFTGEPAYFYHITQVVKSMLSQLSLTVKDIDYCVFHTPNVKFPKQVALRLGFSEEQLKFSLVVNQIGNTYAAASLLALASVLDNCKSDKLILVASYGSGAGSDAFLLRTTQQLSLARQVWHTNQFNKITVQDYIDKLHLSSYRDYCLAMSGWSH